MDTSRESELIEILRHAGWITTWDLTEQSPHDSMSNVRKTLRILHAAGDVECRKIDENRPELEWRWIPTKENT